MKTCSFLENFLEDGLGLGCNEAFFVRKLTLCVWLRFHYCDIIFGLIMLIFANPRKRRRTTEEESGKIKKRGSLWGFSDQALRLFRFGKELSI